MNRITRLIHKANFLPRHRRIIDFSHRYVITADDLSLPQVNKEPENPVMTDERIEAMLEEFNPDENAIDRRIFYEVTGRQLIDGEFAEN